MKSQFLLSLLLLPLILCGAVFPAWASINGSVEWNYVDYDIDKKKGKDHKATSFFQRYSVMHRQAGILGGGRLGSWNLGLGAEWAAFETEIDDKTYDTDSFKVLYNGDLFVAPGAMPFRS